MHVVSVSEFILIHTSMCQKRCTSVNALSRKGSDGEVWSQNKALQFSDFPHKWESRGIQ